MLKKHIIYFLLMLAFYSLHKGYNELTLAIVTSLLNFLDLPKKTKQRSKNKNTNKYKNFLAKETDQFN